MPNVRFLLRVAVSFCFHLLRVVPAVQAFGGYTCFRNRTHFCCAQKCSVLLGQEKETVCVMFSACSCFYVRRLAKGFLVICKVTFTAGHAS